MGKSREFFVGMMGTLEAIPKSKRKGSFIGQRAWKLGSDDVGLCLTSLAAAYAWTGPVVRDSDPPNFFRKNGFNAFKVGMMPERYDAYGVIGEVDLFGGVIEHEHGYRAQCAKIRRLALLPYNKSSYAFLTIYDTNKPRVEEIPETIKALQDRYQCPVEVCDTRMPHPIKPKEVDSEECPICKKKHPDNPLSCQASEADGLRALQNNGGHILPGEDKVGYDSYEGSVDWSFLDSYTAQYNYGSLTWLK